MAFIPTVAIPTAGRAFNFSWPSVPQRAARMLAGPASPGIAVGMTIDQAKSQFFDRYVYDRTRTAEFRFLAKMGAYIMSDANRSMRSVGSKAPASKPGTPPRSRVGHLKKYNYFLVEPYNTDVIVGPILLRGSRIAVPGVHEHGQIVLRRMRKHPRSQTMVMKRLHYSQRPFMAPALAKNLKKVHIIKDSIRK